MTETHTFLPPQELLCVDCARPATYFVQAWWEFHNCYGQTLRHPGRKDSYCAVCKPQNAEPIVK